jgi:hypothetical protein
MITALLFSFVGKWGSKLLVLMALVAAVLAGIAWLDHRGYERGYSAREAIAKKQLDDQAKADAAQLQKNIADAAARNDAAIKALGLERDQSATSVADLRKQLAEEEAKWKRDNPHAKSPPLAACTVSPDTLSVLNRALAGAPAKPASGSAAGRAHEAPASAPSPQAPASDAVTGTDLAEHDLTLQSAYNQLAIQLNGLIDWVQAQMGAPK